MATSGHAAVERPENPYYDAFAPSISELYESAKRNGQVMEPGRQRGWLLFHVGSFADSVATMIGPFVTSISLPVWKYCRRSHLAKGSDLVIDDHPLGLIVIARGRARDLR